MTRSTSTARESLSRALSTTTVHRRLMLPDDVADHLLEPDDEVLLALPGLPDDTPKIAVVTTREVVLGRWNTLTEDPQEIVRKRAVPASDVRGAEYLPGLHYPVEIAVDGARDVKLEPSTPEDGIRFAHALHTLATTGRVPAPLPPAEVIAVRHSRGTYSPDSEENRMRAAWDRALLATTDLWNCTAIHSGPALGWLEPGEHTLLVLVGTASVTVEYLAVTDRRVFRGNAPGRRVKEHPASGVRRAVCKETWLSTKVTVEMHDGSTLKMRANNSHEGQEFVDALNTLITTGALPPELQPFR